jgi:hypothetical protein
MNLRTGFNVYHFPHLVWLNPLWITAVFLVVAARVRGFFGMAESTAVFLMRRAAGIMAPLAALFVLMFAADVQWPWIFLAGMPFAMLWISINTWHTRGNPVRGFAVALKYLAHFRRLYSNFLVFILFVFLGMMLVLSPLLFGIEYFIRMNFRLDGEEILRYLELLTAGLFYWIGSLLLCYLLFSFGILSFTLREVVEAHSLRKKVLEIKPRKRVQGLETE